MPKRETQDALYKHTLHLYAGDYAALQMLYPKLTAAVAIREIVRAHLRKIEENVQPSTPDVEL